MAGRGTDMQRRLAYYMLGWSKGSAGAAVDNRLLDDPDFAAGHTQGRHDKIEACSRAATIYGCTFDPLRGRPTSPDTESAS